MKEASTGCLLAIELFAVVAMALLHEAVLSRWLPPLASALASAVLVSLALAPIYPRLRPLSGRRILIALGGAAILIFLLAKLG